MRKNDLDLLQVYRSLLGGNSVTATAKLFKVSRAHLYNQMKRVGATNKLSFCVGMENQQ